MLDDFFDLSKSCWIELSYTCAGGIIRVCVKWGLTQLLLKQIFIIEKFQNFYLEEQNETTYSVEEQVMILVGSSKAKL